MRIILKNKWDEVETLGNPRWARDLGYEPGRAGKRNTLEFTKTDLWESVYPLIDIRHTRNMTVPKWDIEHFRKKPKNWKVDKIKNIPGWNKPWELVT